MLRPFSSLELDILIRTRRNARKALSVAFERDSTVISQKDEGTASHGDGPLGQECIPYVNSIYAVAAAVVPATLIDLRF